MLIFGNTVFVLFCTYKYINNIKIYPQGVPFQKLSNGIFATTQSDKKLRFLVSDSISASDNEVNQPFPVATLYVNPV